jgi:phosphate/sulfate permease
MMAEVSASFIVKFTAARVGIPISATHDFIGAFLGSGMASLGPRALNYSMLT